MLSPAPLGREPGKSICNLGGYNENPNYSQGITIGLDRLESGKCQLNPDTMHHGQYEVDVEARSRRRMRSLRLRES